MAAGESPDYAHRSRASSLRPASSLSPNRVCCGFIVPPTLPLVKVASLRLQFSLSALVSHLSNLDGPSSSTSTHLRHDALYASHLSPRRPPQDGPWVVRIFSSAYVHILHCTPLLRYNLIHISFSSPLPTQLFSDDRGVDEILVQSPYTNSHTMYQHTVARAPVPTSSGSAGYLVHLSESHSYSRDAMTRFRSGTGAVASTVAVSTHHHSPISPAMSQSNTHLYNGIQNDRSHIYPYLRIHARTSKV